MNVNKYNYREKFYLSRNLIALKLICSKFEKRKIEYDKKRYILMEFIFSQAVDIKLILKNKSFNLHREG